MPSPAGGMVPAVDAPTLCPVCKDHLLGVFCQDCGAARPQRWEGRDPVCCDWGMIALPGPNMGIGVCFDCLATVDEDGIVR